jgi:hypothetical protein
MGPNPAWEAHHNVSDFALSDQTAGTVKIYSIGVVSTKSEMSTNCLLKRGTANYLCSNLLPYDQVLHHEEQLKIC